MGGRVRDLGRHGGSVLLAAVGVALLAAALAQPSGRDPFAVALLACGTGLVVLATVLPRLVNAEVSPTTGLKLSLASERDASTRLAASATAADVDAGGAVVATRVLLASETMERLLEPHHGPLAGVAFHLYLFDGEQDLLVPAFEGQPSPQRAWRIGTGAVGEAWERGEYVLARDEQVSDGTFGLTPDQQARYQELSVVAAMPVTNARGEVIAVLAGSSTDPGSALAGDEGFDAQLLMAQEVARVLVDLLKWFTDW
jgi:putative methionine-R-sulfoxide reductase with GAF domain